MTDVDTATTTAETATFPQPRGCPFDPPAQFGEQPISKVTLVTGAPAWLLTRHEDVRAMLSDPRFSADRRKPGFPQLVARNAFRSQPPSMITLDGAEHSASRRAVIGEFTVRRLASLTPRIQQIVDEFIDAMLLSPQPADLVQLLSLPVPSMVICELLGVPYADHDFFQSRTSRLLRRTTSEEETVQIRIDLRGYLDQLLASKEAEPTDDLLGRQILRQREETGTVDRESLISLALLLLIAGHETTANMISLGVVALLTHPEQLAAIRDDPAKTPLAVEELLRYFSIAAFATSRLATEDVELGGVLIRAGEGVIGDSLAANRDEATFGEPDTLDVRRGARSHVAFGFGPHQCLGQNLARTELRIVFDTLFSRIPTLCLAADLTELPFKEDANIYGVYQLPVTW